MLPVIAVLSLAQAPVEPTILALTPVLDGRVVSEEWMAVPGSSTYLQWEPGRLHVAGTFAEGECLIVSVDTAADGWLVGKDNREYRVRFVGGKPELRERTLDATLRSGPAWIEQKAEPFLMAVGKEGSNWTVEGTITFPDSVVREGRVMGVRVETMPGGGDTGPAFLPRALSYVKFGFDASEGLPAGMSWRSETKLRQVARADGVSMRFELSGAGDYDTAEVRCEGWGRNALTTITKQFQGFDSRGNASFEYKSDINDEGPAGWRVLRATLHNPDGSRTVLRTSFRMCELIEFDVDIPRTLKYSNKARTIKGRLDVRSTGTGRVDGQYDVATERDWFVKKGGAQRILIYQPRGRERINLEFAIPAGMVGSYPVTFTVNVGEMSFSRTIVIEIEPPA